MYVIIGVVPDSRYLGFTHVQEKLSFYFQFDKRPVLMFPLLNQSCMLYVHRTCLHPSSTSYSEQVGSFLTVESYVCLLKHKSDYTSWV